MKEMIFNLFLFIEGDIIHDLGTVVHEKGGTDEDKIAFLQSQVLVDLKSVKRFTLPDRYVQVEQKTNVQTTGLLYEKFQTLMQMGRHLEVFEEVFQVFNAPDVPLVCVTPIINNKPRIDKVEKFSPFYDADAQEISLIAETTMPDYLTAYLTEEGFDLSRLLDDDYFLAIKLLFNNGYYVSALKLLVSFIDTLAFLEFGDSRGIFTRWLDKYADLNRIGIKASELVELRHSLLHMTNLDSRNVLSGKAKRLLYYVGTMPKGFPVEDDEGKYFSLMELIKSIAIALELWCASFNNDPSKFETFFNRYDRVISDVRYGILKIE